MKIFIKRILILIFLTLFLINVFKYSDIVTTSSINAINLWIQKLFPSLFIMFIINDLIINTDSYLYIVKILKLKSNKSIAFLLSIFSGTPANAFIIKELLINQKINLDDANKLLMYTYFSNPLFLYNILILMFNESQVIKLIFIHYISNIFIYLIVKNKTNDYLCFTYNNYNIFSLLEKSIKRSVNTLLMILGTITFFMILSNLLVKVFELDLYTEILIKGIFEITQSLNDLTNINVNNNLKQLLVLSIVSFGGISIHMQIFSIISNTKIEYKYFLKGRVFHVLISIILLLISFII